MCFISLSQILTHLNGQRNTPYTIDTSLHQLTLNNAYKRIKMPCCT